ncbi:hypothetical protein JCM18382A_04510 [Bradyrhizobium sp. 17-4]
MGELRDGGWVSLRSLTVVPAKAILRRPGEGRDPLPQGCVVEEGCGPSFAQQLTLVVMVPAFAGTTTMAGSRFVIARSEATTQSMAPHARRNGLLRCARNDEER